MARKSKENNDHATHLKASKKYRRNLNYLYVRFYEEDIDIYNFIKNYPNRNGFILDLIKQNKEAGTQPPEYRKLKPTGKPVRCVETGEVFPSQAAAARWAKVLKENINAVVRGKQGIAGGYHWEYADETDENSIKND